MKFSRTVAAFLVIALTLGFGAWSAPASATSSQSMETPTRLYHRTVPATKKALREQWPSNATGNTVNNDGGMAHSEITIDGQTIPLQAYINDGVNGVLEIRLPDLNLDTRDYGEMELLFRYARFTDYEYDEDVNIEWANSFKVYASVDGGKRWSKEYATLKEQRVVGRGYDGEAMAVIYEAVSTDLTKLAEGEVITALKIVPYGTMVRTEGFAHILSITVNGYETEAPGLTKPETKYIPVEEDVLRQIVVQQMYDTLDVEWTTETEILSYNGSSPLYYKAGYLYKSPVYCRWIDTSMEMMLSAMDESGVYTGGMTDETVYGMDCIGIVYDALSRVTGGPGFGWCYVFSDLCAQLKGGLVNETLTRDTREIIGSYTTQEIYEAYATLEPGDFILRHPSGIHSRLVTGQTKVIRNSDGMISGDSTVIYSETAGANRYYWQKPDGSIVTSSEKDVAAYQAANPTYTYLYGTSCRKNVEITFEKLLGTTYLPYTLKEYQQSRVQAPRIITHDAPDAETVTKTGLDILLESNYYLNNICATVVDMQTGKTLFADRVYEQNDVYVAEYSNSRLDALLAGLPAGAYRLAVDVCSGPVTEVGGEIPVTRAVELDVAVGGATVLKPLDLTQADGWAVNWLDRADKLGLLSQLNRQGFTSDVTRLQFADMAVRAAQAITGKPIAPAPADSFTDTRHESILKAKAAGIAGGYEVDGKFEFRPDKPITRQEICVMLAHVVEYVQANGTQVELNTGEEIAAGFPDRGQVADWAQKQVALMTNNGIMGGRATDKGNMLTPNANTALQEAVTLSVKLMDCMS
ncbi:MAG: S-layer homology domain-containing protein [Oscillospiraceae bacterium]|nr:S-layer homology domain-containing protein [Oscillospiraceae bacterium]